MTTIGKDFPVRAHAFLLSSEKRASSAAISPADTLCLDIFSPQPGDSDVASQVDRLSSNETHHRLMGSSTLSVDYLMPMRLSGPAQMRPVRTAAMASRRGGEKR